MIIYNLYIDTNKIIKLTIKSYKLIQNNQNENIQLQLPGHQLWYVNVLSLPSQIQIEPPMRDIPTPEVMMLPSMFCLINHSDTKSFSTFNRLLKLILF